MNMLKGSSNKIFKRSIVIWSASEFGQFFAGFGPLATILVFATTFHWRMVAVDKSNDKRFSETTASLAEIRATDKEVLNGIVRNLSTDIKASNELLSEKIKTLTENTLRLEKIVENNASK